MLLEGPLTAAQVEIVARLNVANDSSILFRNFGDAETAELEALEFLGRVHVTESAACRPDSWTIVEPRVRPSERYGYADSQAETRSAVLGWGSGMSSFDGAGS